MARTCRDLRGCVKQTLWTGARIGILLWIQKENIMLAKLTEQFEAASADYTETHGMLRDPDWFVLKLQEEMGELTQAWNRATGRGRKKGRSDEDLSRDLAVETADLLGHVLLFAHTIRIDLASAIERKWLFRPEKG
jgi:NTP pyrophosphatase (non-canonical NTP hydrolase)